MADNRQVSALIGQLKHRDPKQRLSAANKLGQMGEVACDAIPALISTFQRDGDKAVIGVVSFALGQMGEPAVAGLIELLKVPRLRTKVCKSLRKIGTAEAVKAVEEYS